MSRPWQFTDRDDVPNSPLDRRQQTQQPGQPPSFKTNVNRAKTKKWVEAKQVSYGGDDWDDYDEDDEYGVSSAVDERPPPIASSQNRSFTTPVPGSQQDRLQRSNSFERGDERRAFSSSQHPAPAGPPRSPGPPLHVDTGMPAHHPSVTDSESQYSQSAGGRQVSAASFAPSDNSMNPEHRRDFSPSAMPQPLNTVASPIEGPMSPASAAKRAFIRPSDIYKRMGEEQEKERRASLESSRRSGESARSHEPAPPAKVPTPEPRMESTYQMGAPLETVAERKSEYGLPGLPTTSESSKPGFSGLSLPQFESDSNFGSFWDQASKAKEAERAAQSPQDANLQHQPSVGYRSMVNQAFDQSGNVRKQDSTRSQAPTESSGLTRSDTTGTSDISPILGASTHADQKSRSPAAIPEEPELDERGRARRSAERDAIADIQPGFRRSLDPPSGANSPARSPAVEIRNPLRDPVSAEVHNEAADSSFREADLASASATGPSAPVANLERAAQNNFIQTHDLPPEASSRISRSESPTKGRVADLAGKFNEPAPDSRRNSQQSIGSKKSESSLMGSSRPTSSHGPPVASRPVAEREISFRPKLPGGFESYISTKDPSPERVATPASEPEITPTTAKQPLDGKDTSKESSSNAGPMAALAAAGAAIAASIQGTVGGSESADKDTGDRDRAVQQPRGYGDIYNRPLPPDRMESEFTTSSTMPPTPLPKDDVDPITPVATQAPQAPSIVTKDLPQPPKLEHRDTAESGDFESDHIRREIVRSLSPTAEETPKAAASSLGVPENRAPNRQSHSVLSEYESYWAGSDDEDGEPKMSATALPSMPVAPLPLKPTKSVELPAPEPVAKDLPAEPVPVIPAQAPIAQPAPVTASAVAESPATGTPASARPGFLTQRFSWEMTPADSPVKEAPNPVEKAPEPAAAATSAPVKQEDKLKPTDPLSLNPKTSSDHLYIRNAEAGEIPSPVEPRGPSLDSIREQTPKPIEEPVSPVGPMSPVSPMVPTMTRETPAGPRALSSGKTVHDGHEVRPPSFREILAIKSTPLRIAKYDETRLQFANMNTGLSHWLQRTTQADPSLRDVNNPMHRPSMPPTISTTSPGGARHKATASLTKVFSGAGGDKLPTPADSTPEYRPSPTTPSERTSAAALKGKELFNKAGAIGGKQLGKGMKEAKGLFAKGKSRFRASGGGEKAYPSLEPLSPSLSLSRRSSISSFTSSVFSAASSRRSSFDSTPPISRRVSLDLALLNALCPSSDPANEEIVSKKESDDDMPSFMPDDDDFYDQPLWSEGWLRENTDFTVMALFGKKNKKEDKPVFGQPNEEEDPELAANTRANSARPITPRQGGGPMIGLGGQMSQGPAPALPSFAFESKPSSRPTSRNGPVPLSEPPPKGGIMKHSNASSGGLAVPGAQGRSVSSPLAGGAGTGPTLKMGDRNSHGRIVSMMAPGSGDEDEDPPSPVSPVDEDEQKFPPNGKDALGRSGNLRMTSSNPKLPSLNTGLTPSISMGSPMLRPNSHIGIGGVDSPSRSRVSFAPPEPKGKGKAMDGADTPTTAARKHARFDSSNFPEKEDKKGKGKDSKVDKASKKSEEKAPEKKKFGPGLIIPMLGKGRGRGRGGPPGAAAEPVDTDTLSPLQPPPGRGRGRGLSGSSTPTGPGPRAGSLAPPSAMKNRQSQPESGQLKAPGLQRANSSFDRMAAIANAHRMMREQFDEVNGVSDTPADLAVSENAARAAAQSQEALAIPSIPEERPGSSSTHNRSRASSIASYQDERSRSREGRTTGLSAHGATDSRSSSMPRYTPGSGARASSIPRPESIVGGVDGDGGRRQSWGSGAASPGQNIGIAVTTNVLSISKGQQPPTPVVPAGINGLPSQQRRSSGTASPSAARLSAGPGPTLRDGSPGPRAPTPTMVVTSPDSSPSKKLSQQTSSGGTSYHSVSTMGDAASRTGPSDSKPSVSPVRQSVEGKPQRPVSRERPMSYIMLARDEHGVPISERISTAKHPIGGAPSEADEDATAGASPAVDKKTLNRLLGEGSDRGSASGQTSRSSMRTEEDDDLYKQPSPRVTAVPSNELQKKTSSEPIGNPKHRSVQLYDRPFSRDESASGTSTPSHQSRSQTPAQPAPDADPIAQQQAPPTPASAKKGLLSKLKGKPGPVVSVAASGHSQTSSRDTTHSSNTNSPEDQRLSSMTSTTASVQSDVNKKRRGSGFFSMKRSSSTEPIRPQDDSVIPPHNQVRINTNVNSVASPASSGMSTPRRSATSVEPTKKRRGTFSNIFSRNSPSTTSMPPPPVPQKPSAKNTIFHRVPPAASPQQSNDESQQRFSGPRDLHSGKESGYSTPQQGRGSRPTSGGSRPPSSSGRPGSFVHQHGASGMAAIDAQQESQVTTTITGPGGRKERRSMSLTGSGGLFGRKRSDSNDSRVSVESQTKLRKGRKWGSKGSITEGVQHQERPWAITIPGAEEDERSKEIERQEILHAATSRRQQSTDNQPLYPHPEQSPNSVSSPASYPTPISPQARPIPMQQQTLPGSQQGGQWPAYPPRGSSAEQRTPSHNRGEPNNEQPRPSMARSPSSNDRPVPYRSGHYDPEKPESYTYTPAQAIAAAVGAAVSPPAQPIIPQMPQSNLPLMQPQPRRGSQQAGVQDPRMDPSYRSTGSASRTNTTANPTASHTAPPTNGHRSQVSRDNMPGTQGRPVNDFVIPPRSGSARASSRDGPQQERRPSVPMKDRSNVPQRGPSRGDDEEAGASDSNNFVAALEAERRRHGDHTGMGPSSHKSRKHSNSNLRVNVPVTSGAPPPQVGVLSDTTAAVAGLSTHRSTRKKEEDPDSAPVMKATSFPGDEWVPEFYYE